MRDWRDLVKTELSKTALNDKHINSISDREYIERARFSIKT